MASTRRIARWCEHEVQAQLHLDGEHEDTCVDGSTARTMATTSP
jgi:hypothetical protein